MHSLCFSLADGDGMRTACMGCPMLGEHKRCAAAGNLKLPYVAECPRTMIRLEVENDSKRILKPGEGN